MTTEPPLYFICYSRAQDEFVHKVEKKLAARARRMELRLFRDTRMIGAYEPFDKVIQRAIAEAVGAIVVVSDDWHDSAYVQDEEWPALKLKHQDTGGEFAILPIAIHRLSDDDPLRAHNFVNDLSREVIVSCDENTRDIVLTKLDQTVGKHAKARARGERRPMPAASSVASVVGSVRRRQGPVPLNPGIHGVPELPSVFVTPVELSRLCESIREGARSAVCGLRGEGGTGKSMLAAAAARHLVDEFPGGVHWVTVGERATEEDVRRLQADLLASLDDPVDGQLRDFNEGKDRLAAALADRPALVVIDDAWRPWQAIAFDALPEGSPARLVFTTRYPEVLPYKTEALDLERLSARDATQFLEQGVGLPPPHADTAAAIEAAGGLRLALAVMAAVVRATGDWDAVLSRLDGLTVRFGKGDDASSAQKLLHIAASTLDDDDRRRLYTLGVFPPDTSVPISLLADLWATSLDHANKVLVRLADRNLVTFDGTDVALHDHAHDFIVLAAVDPLLASHVRLWELAQRWRAEGGWIQLQRRSRYLWDRLVWHACRAGLNSADLRAIAGDTDWLVARIRLDGVAAAHQDLSDICHRTGAGEDEPIERLRRALLHSAIFDAAATDAGLEASVAVWRAIAGVEASTVLEVGSLPLPSRGLLRTLTGHTAGVLGVEFNHDSSRLATVSEDGTARIWDAATGQTLTILTGHTGIVWAVAFNHDGTRLATTSYDGTARIWDAATGQTLTILSGHTGIVWGVAFSHDGTRLATTSYDGTARIWDAATGQTLTILTILTGIVWAVAFNHDSTHLATVSQDGTARVWDTSTGHTLTILTGHTSALRGVAFNHDGSRLATASDDGTARIWDTSTGQTLTVLTGHTSALRGVAFNHDSTHLATASYDGTARIWDTSTGQTLTVLTGHTSALRGVAFSHDGSRLATASYDGTARIWDTSRYTLTTVTVTVTGHGRHTDTVWGVGFNHDGTRLATTSYDGTARIWDAGTGQTLTILTGHTGTVLGVAFNPDGTRLATTSDDGTARIWDADTGQTLTILTGHTGTVRGVAFNHDGTRLATTSDDGTARIWDTATGQTLTMLTGAVRGVAFNHDSTRLATTSNDGTARIWDTTTGDTLTILTGHTSIVRGVAFNHDSSRLATTGDDGTARIWDTTTGHTLTILTGHTGIVRGVAFNHDSTRLATASFDGTARIWDIGSGRCLLTLALACSGSLAWRHGSLLVAAGPHWAIVHVPET